MTERDYIGILRKLYGEWSRGNFRAGPERFDEDTALVMRPEFPDAGPYRGRSAATCAISWGYGSAS